ncbi:MAG: molecular chaperone HtpG, partial [Victivallales bacterium]|nr:molecular chaperone HtpG [Victivallales bacterium]
MAEPRQFKTEVQKLLDLVINSLYSNKEIFLRELISNASDAIDRVRFDALKDESLLGDDTQWKIKLIVDKDAKTLTVRDNGIGMTAEEVENNIGTIASSGTKKFLEQLSANKENLPPELIGQFGVGFYSAFMVADEVTVLTRRAGTDGKGVKWQSKGDGFYTLEDCDKATRGTDVILHLKEEAENFLEEWEIRKLIKKYSDFVEHPICMDIRREEYERDDEGKRIEGKEPKVTIEEETLNSQKAIWQRPKNEIKPEEYSEFYKHVSHDFQDPFETIHWSVEGNAEFKALLFIPKKPLFDMFMPDQKDKGVQLYVHRVFITDKCEELVPSYLSFLRGVVDSSDLPLNVSREMLQEAKAMSVIQKNVTKKILDTLTDMQSKSPDRYLEFWTNFGSILKSGIHIDFANSERIQKLMLFESTTTEAGKRTTLEEYVKRMPESQKEIYYITAESSAAAANSPQLEAFKSKGYEVLYMTDPIDEWIVQDIREFEGKHLHSIIKGDVDLDTEEEKKAHEEERKAEEESNKDLLAKIKELLGDKVKEVRLSKRLTESACCIVNDEYGLSANMEKILKAMNQEVPEAKRIFEINGN